jgi:fructokinase
VFGVILGTGCGGGLVVRGSLLTGPNGLAGEWGHTPLPWPAAGEWPGPECYCGRRGCLETWISGPGFERDFERVSGRALGAAEIVATAAAGDREAEAALQRLDDRIARGLSTVVDIVDPDVIVLGGGLSRIDRLYAGGVSSRLRDYGFGGNVQTPIRRNLHGDSSGVRGAAWLWPASTSAHPTQR